MRYIEIADSVARLIERGSLRAGDRIPSVRKAGASHGVSVGTMVQAYNLLEMRGLVEARPHSGYYVKIPPKVIDPVGLDRSSSRLLELQHNQRRLAMLSGLMAKPRASLGSAMPSHSFYPLPLLSRSLAVSNRRVRSSELRDDVQYGYTPLRREISKRYLELGYSVPAEEIIVTCGATEAINLAIQVLTGPGDNVLVDSLMFYSGIRLLTALELNPVVVPTDPQTGMDLDVLESTLQREKISACLLMTKCHNPLGFTLPEEKKEKLVQILARHEVPLVENDVYMELQFDDHARAAKAFDRTGSVLHVSSFSKCLAPGNGVGWIAGGRYRDALLERKFVVSLRTPMPVQRAVAHYLKSNIYSRSTRALRERFRSQVALMSQAVERYFPQGTKISSPSGGFILWVELPDHVDALEFSKAAAKENIGIGVGEIFSPVQGCRNCIRLNCGLVWSPEIEDAIKWLGNALRVMP